MRRALLAIPLLSVAVLAGEPVEPTLALRTTIRKALKEGRTAEALEALKTMVGFPGGIYPFEEPWIRAALKDDPAFQQLEKAYERDYPPVVHSQLAFTVTDRDLIPEGLAFDPVDRLLYMGSMPTHSILRLTLDGKASTFVAPGQDGLAEVIGIRVDAKRRTLWAASLSDKETGVLAFDLATGRLLRKATLPREGHLLNDLVVTPAGDVVVTDSDGSTLYRLPAGGSALEPLPVADALAQRDRHLAGRLDPLRRGGGDRHPAGRPRLAAGRAPRAPGPPEPARHRRPLRPRPRARRRPQLALRQPGRALPPEPRRHEGRARRRPRAPRPALRPPHHRRHRRRLVLLHGQPPGGSLQVGRDRPGPADRADSDAADEAVSSRTPAFEAAPGSSTSFGCRLQRC